MFIFLLIHSVIIIMSENFFSQNIIKHESFDYLQLVDNKNIVTV